MAIVRLLLNALASWLMTIGLLAAGALLQWLADAVWRRFDDKHSIPDIADRWNLCLAPGIIAQLWYAGFAAHLVRSTEAEASTVFAVAAHIAGLLGVVLAAGVFDVFYRVTLHRYWTLRPSLVIGGVSVFVYVVLLWCPPVALALNESWTWLLRILAVFADNT